MGVLKKLCQSEKHTKNTENTEHCKEQLRELVVKVLSSLFCCVCLFYAVKKELRVYTEQLFEYAQGSN